MAIKFPDTMILVSDVWTDFVAAIEAKSLVSVLQYDEDSDAYTIFAVDGILAYTCKIWKGTVPPTVAVTYSQGQNDTDKSDWETNYKDAASKPNVQRAAIYDQQTPTVVGGYTTATGSAFTPILATSYAEQASEAQRSVSSSDANDTSAGDGARTVRITYYDGNMDGPFEEIVTLNGTTAVNTVATNIRFVENMEILTVGAQMGNMGTISLHVSTGGAGGAVGSIAAGDNQTYWCHHYVAPNKTAKVSDLIASIEGQYGGSLHLRRSTPTVANTPEKTIAPVIGASPGVPSHVGFAAPVEVEGPARLILYAKGSFSTGDMSWLAGFSYYEV